MRHEMNQEQVRALGTAVIKSGTAVVTVGQTAVRRWTRARALAAAVATHNARSNKGSVYDILGTARAYERYIETGRVNGNE